MHKRLLFISFLSLILVNGYSQKANHKSSLTLSLGPSFPLGKYANKNLDDDRAGLAGIGEQVNISYDLKLWKHISLSATLYGQRNGIKAKDIAADLSQRKYYDIGVFVSTPGFPPPVVTTYSTYPNWKIDKKAWMMGSVLLGATGEFPFKPSGKLSFIAKIMAGAIYVSSPKIHGMSVTDTTEAVIDQQSKSTFGVSFLLRTGLKYNINKRWSFIAGIDHFSTSSITFHDVQTTLTTVKRVVGNLIYAAQQMQTADGKQAINTLNLNVGIGFKL